MKAQELDDLGYGNSACGGGIFRVVSADWGVGVGTVFPEVGETAGSGRYGVAVLQVGGLHDCVFLPAKVLLCVKE